MAGGGREQARPQDAMGSSASWCFAPALHWQPEVRAYFELAFGVEAFERMSEALCLPPRSSCLRVNTMRTSTPEVLASLEAALQPSGVGATPIVEVQSLSSGGHEANSLQGEGEWHVTTNDGKQLAAPMKGLKCSEHCLLKDVILVEGKGGRKVAYRQEERLGEVVVSRRCGEAVLRGAEVFVPGVLACSPNLEEGDAVAVSVAVESPDGAGGWHVGYTRGATLGSSHAEAKGAGLDRSNCYVGKGCARLSRRALFSEERGVAVEMTERAFDLPPMHGLLKGDVLLQNLPSIVAARVLGGQMDGVQRKPRGELHHL